MKQTLLLLVVLIAFAKGRYDKPDGYGYTMIDSASLGGPTYQWTTLTAPQDLGLGDETTARIIFFPFHLYAGTINTITVSSNGFLCTACESAGCCDGQPIPTANFAGLIAGWWSDLDATAGGTIHYQIMGSAPNRVLIVEWANVPFYFASTTDTISMQIKLFETTNIIEVHYDSAPTQEGAQVVAGIQMNALAGSQYVFTQDTPLPQGTAVRYIPPSPAATCNPPCSYQPGQIPHCMAPANPTCSVDIPPVAATCPFPDTFGYSCRANTPYNWQFPTIRTNLTLTDDSTIALTLPFAFRFYNVSFTQFYVSSNGFIGFDLTTQSPACCSGQQLPDQFSPFYIVAAWWTDLNPSVGGEIYWGVTGSTGNRVVIITWNNVPHYGAPTVISSFQIKLFESDNHIEVHHLSSMALVNSFTTIGCQNLGTAGLTIFHGDTTPTPLTTAAYSFIPPAVACIPVCSGTTPCINGTCRTACSGCQNGGTCNANGGCNCPATTAGAFCQFQRCLNPCLHGGVCVDGASNQCDCTNAAGWTGARCEVATCNPACTGDMTCQWPNLCAYTYSMTLGLQTRNNNCPRPNAFSPSYLCFDSAGFSLPFNDTTPATPGFRNVFVGAALSTMSAQCSNNASTVSASVAGFSLGSRVMRGDTDCHCNSVNAIDWGAPTSSTSSYAFRGSNTINFALTANPEPSSRVCLPANAQFSVYYILVPGPVTTGSPATTQARTTTTTTTTTSSSTSGPVTSSSTPATSSSSGPITTQPVTTGPNQPNGVASTGSPSGGGLSGGAIAAAVIIPLIVVIILCIVGIIFFVRWRKRKSETDYKLRQAAAELEAKDRSTA